MAHLIHLMGQKPGNSLIVNMDKVLNISPCIGFAESSRIQYENGEYTILENTSVEQVSRFIKGAF